MSDRIDGIFYFDVPVPVAWERLRARGTATDLALSQSYLTRVEAAYYRWLESSPCDRAPLVMVDGTGDTDPVRLLHNMDCEQTKIRLLSSHERRSRAD